MTPATQRLARAANYHLDECTTQSARELRLAIKAVESETAQAQAQPAISEEQIKAMASECEEIALDADYAMGGVPSVFAFEEIIRRHIKHTGSTNAKEGASDWTAEELAEEHAAQLAEDKREVESDQNESAARALADHKRSKQL